MKKVFGFSIGNLIGGVIVGFALFVISYFLDILPVLVKSMRSYSDPLLSVFYESVLFTLPFFFLNFLNPSFRRQFKDFGFSFLAFPLIFFTLGAFIAGILIYAFATYGISQMLMHASFS